MYSVTSKHAFFHKIKNITEKAYGLLQSVETDLIDFSSSNDLDMSGVKTAIQKYYEELMQHPIILLTAGKRSKCY